MQGYAKNTVSDLVKVQSGTVTTASTFTISSLTAGAKYKLVFTYLQNTATGILRMQVNGDTGGNYNWSVGAYTGGDTNVNTTYANMVEGGGYVGIGFYGHLNVEFSSAYGNNQRLFWSGSAYSEYSAANVYSHVIAGKYNGSAAISSITLFPTGGTVTGTWTLYQLS